MVVGMVGALWVALVASVAALMSAVLAPLTNWLVSTAAHRHEREMRIREDRITAYTTLLRECKRRVLVVEEIADALGRDDPDHEMPEPLIFDQARWLDEAAVTLAFLSDEVSAALTEFEKLMETYTDLCKEQRDEPTDATGVIAMTAIKLGLEKRYEGLARTIRRELTQ